MFSGRFWVVVSLSALSGLVFVLAMVGVWAMVGRGWF